MKTASCESHARSRPTLQLQQVQDLLGRMGGRCFRILFSADQKQNGRELLFPALCAPWPVQGSGEIKLKLKIKSFLFHSGLLRGNRLCSLCRPQEFSVTFVMKQALIFSTLQKSILESKPGVANLRFKASVNFSKVNC